MFAAAGCSLCCVPSTPNSCLPSHVPRCCINRSVVACAHAHASCKPYAAAPDCLPCLSQVLEILSHVNKRTRAAPNVRLPLTELATLYAGEWGPWQPARGRRRPQLPGQLFSSKKSSRKHPWHRRGSPTLAPRWYAAPGSGPMARNFAVVYLEQAIARAPPAERLEQASQAQQTGFFFFSWNFESSFAWIKCTRNSSRARAGGVAG